MRIRKTGIMVFMNEQSHFRRILCLLTVGLVAFGSNTTAQDGSRSKKKDELVERLIRQSTGGSEDIMGETVRLMGESARQLEVKFDAGPDTQSLQQEIVDRLEKAIEYAASQRRMRRRSSSPRGGDKRRMPGKQNQQQQSKQQSTASGQTGEPGTSVDAGGKVDVANQSDGKLKETRRAWGHLPQRERDELIQGKDEAFLEEYRAWIELYFQALQESK